MSKLIPEVGTLMARVEAPTALYRVTSRHGDPARNGFLRVLPYRRSGKEHALVRIGGAWVADGSEWVVSPDEGS